MATRIVMSKLSPTMEEGRVLKWLKREGERVESGEALLEVETDKANMEVEAMGSGVLKKVLVEQDTTVPTGTLLGVIAEEQEDISDILADAAGAGGPGGENGGAGPGAATRGPPAARPAEEPSPTAATAPAAERPALAPAPARMPAAPGDGGRLKASPLARRMAEERGIVLSRVRGSGPGGRIIKRDVEAAAGAGAPTLEAAVAGVGAEAPYERLELTQIRKAIARNMSQSLGPIPHFYLTLEIDMGRVLELREQLNASLADAGVRIGLNDILVKTAAQALAQHPDVNAGFGGNHIRRFQRVDIGIAVALPDGLITPVLRDVTTKGLRRLSAESKELIERARAKKLVPEEYQGATFTISNLGMYGIDEFTAVINPPAATILAVGATQEKPVAIDGAVEIRSRMRVTLSCDHRVVDGAMGADFLATFRDMLENPLRLVL